MKKLISMTDYVLEQRKNQDTDNIRRLWACERYANFLKLPLTLGMFIPTDENGIPYESYHSYSVNNNTICEPYEGLFEIDVNSKCSGWKYLDSERTRYYDSVSYEIAKQKFQQAKELVIFEGFENIELIEKLILLNETIEILDDLGITITETAVKKYGL